MNYYPNFHPYSQAAPDQLQQLRQPYQMSYQQPQMQQSAMVWVRGRMEAENYPVAPNTAIALWDVSGPYVHRKEADMSGRPTVKTYQLVEVTEPPQTANNPGNNYVTREEFAAFVESLAHQNGGKYAKKEEPVNE